MGKYLTVCDVSDYQSPALVPWGDPRIAAGIVKANEGSVLQRHYQDHVAEIRKAGKPFGLYLFFRPDVDVLTQLDAFSRAAKTVAYGVGQLIPAVDIERYYKRGQSGATWVEPMREWNEPAERLCAALRVQYGAVYVYGGVSTWLQMGRPAWWLEHRLWVPRYNYNGNPPPDPDKIGAPGGKSWDLAQTLVGPLFSPVQRDNDARAVDQSQAKNLVRIEDRATQPAPSAP